MGRKFTRRSDVTNHGGIYTPPAMVRWLIVRYVDGDLTMEELSLSSSTCPKFWLAEKGEILEVDALAEIIP